eukprot:m.15872 g.15872  ORF g.15872 m.15872 type:complete len:931 (-) comp5112_c0_seq1:281-3073(-)
MAFPRSAFMVALTAAMVIVVVLADSVSACSCPVLGISQNHDAHTHVFQAKIVKKLLHDKENIQYLAKVLQPFKGCVSKDEFVVLRTPASSALCGITYVRKQTYLVSGNRKKTSCCNTDDAMAVVNVGSCGRNQRWATVPEGVREWLSSRPYCCECEGSSVGCYCGDGSPMPACLIDPCQSAELSGRHCSASNTECRANPCGPCRAEYYRPDGGRACHKKPCDYKDTTLMLEEVAVDGCEQCRCTKTGLKCKTLAGCNLKAMCEVDDDCDEGEQCVNSECKVTLPSAVCLLEPETGPCRAAMSRFAFDASTGQCKPFVYGGCRGNGNNFVTEQECRAACVSQGPVCSLSVEPGPCRASFRRFAFDSSTGTCQLFIYGGCQGNANNFNSKPECEEACVAELPGCQSDADCVKTHWCRPGFDTGASTCVARVELGGSCGGFRQQPVQCAAGLVCQPRFQYPFGPQIADAPGTCCPELDCLCPREQQTVFDANGCATCRCVDRPCKGGSPVLDSSNFALTCGAGDDRCPAGSSCDASEIGDFAFCCPDVPTATACRSDADCQPSQWCRQSFADAPSACVERVGLGGSCGGNRIEPVRCAAGLQCQEFFQQPFGPQIADAPGTCCPVLDCLCIDEQQPVFDDNGCATCRCVDRPCKGKSPVMSSQGSPFTCGAGDGKCPSGSFCDASQLARFAYCCPEEPEPASCESDSECDPNEFCQFSRNTGTSKCAPRLPLGASCGGFQIASTKCQSNLRCQPFAQFPFDPQVADVPGTCCPVLDCLCTPDKQPVLDSNGCETCRCVDKPCGGATPLLAQSGYGVRCTSGGSCPSGSTCDSSELGNYALCCESGPAPTCEAQLAAARDCSRSADCAASVPGTSCGCTRNHVINKNISVKQYQELFAKCGGGGISTCDCPPASGFSCVAGQCTWDYLMPAPIG